MCDRHARRGAGRERPAAPGPRGGGAARHHPRRHRGVDPRRGRAVPRLRAARGLRGVTDHQVRFNPYLFSFLLN